MVLLRSDDPDAKVMHACIEADRVIHKMTLSTVRQPMLVN
jgi:hypothetical protein